jgi:NAD(P) transhydrogenase subunit alpha
MATLLGVVKETLPGERRVALTPRAAEALGKAGLEVVLEAGAGASAGYPDKDYESRGIRLASRKEVFASAASLAQVRALGANPQAGRDDLPHYRSGQVVLGLGEPLTAPQENQDLAQTGVSYLALELIPRITRAQSMDVLSSMASIAGYKAVLMGASQLPRLLPMMTTAAGTIAPAKVLILGAGVAGLQAIATARRLGAVVSAYDVRPAAKEQVESLGAKFIVLDVDNAGAEDKGGYAKAMDEAFYKRQRELLTDVIREQDLVITTAAVPGRKAPILMTTEMVAAMSPGSVVVDLAAERGGNCEVTIPGETIDFQGVTVMGPMNVASLLPYHASQTFAHNVSAFLKNLMVKGDFHLNREDEIIRETLVCEGGRIVHPKLIEAAERIGVTS